MFSGELAETLGVEHERLINRDSLTLNLDINVNVKVHNDFETQRDAEGSAKVRKVKSLSVLFWSKL